MSKKLKLPALPGLLAITILLGAMPGCRQEPSLRMLQPINQDIDLSRLGKQHQPIQWRPGDPIIEVHDLKSTTTVRVPVNPELQTAGVVLDESYPQGADAPAGGQTLPAAVNALIPVIEQLQSFAGIPATSFQVPDTVGDVGRQHYIQMVNSAFQIFDKQGKPLIPALKISTLWSGKEDPCAAEYGYDPIVRYDELADRWLLSQETKNANGTQKYECIALSKTSEPVSGGWYLYTLPAIDPATNTAFALDFPKISVWPHAYLLTTLRQFPNDGQDVWALNREAMLAGTAITPVRIFVPGPTLFLMPADLDGQPPDPGTPGYFARMVDGERFGGLDRIEVFSLAIDWDNPAAMTLDKLVELPTEPFQSNNCGPEFRAPCIPQLGTSQILDSLQALLMWRLQYRNFDSHESMVLNHTIRNDATAHTAIRWYELRKTPTQPWAIFQQGTLSDAQRNLWMGSIAMNQRGDIAVGYNTSSHLEYPAIRLDGRLLTDAPGSMPQSEFTAVAGAGSQQPVNGRWGDYSSMDVDPEDDCAFWYTGQYYPKLKQGGEAGWRTQIISFRLAGCQ